jgi:RHS repeat-associated protein
MAALALLGSVFQVSSSLTVLAVSPATASAAVSLPPLVSSPLKERALSSPVTRLVGLPGLSAEAGPTEGSTPLPSLTAGAMPAERSSRVDVYDRGDGIQTAVLHAGIVNWKDPASGRWLRLDKDLAKSEKGRWRNGSGPIAVEFAPRTGSGVLAELAMPGWRLGFSMADVAPGVMAEASGPSVRYRDVRPDMDVVEEVTDRGLKESVILNRLPSNTEDLVLRFPLSLAGLTARSEADGGVAFVDAKDRVVARAHPAMAWDGDRAPVPGGTITIRQDVVDGPNGSEIRLTVPGDWLSAPERRAPITIDPTIEVGELDNYFPGPRESWDTFASSPDPNNPGYHNFYANGQWVNLAGYDNYPTSEQYTYQFFDLAAVGLAGKQILSAQWKNFVHQTNGSGYYRLWPVSQAWGETTVTWNNKPNHRPEYVEGTASAGHEANRDITSWVQNWADNLANSALGWPSYGISIDSAGTNSGVRFGSENGHQSMQPKLVVTFNSKPVPAQPSEPAADAALTTITPTLRGLGHSDENGDSLQFLFRLSNTDNPDSGVVYESGWISSNQHKVPAGVLKDGVTYTWRIGTRDANWTSWSNPGKFKIDLLLGDQPAVPFDDVGPVRVNLANGNLVVQASSSTLNTVGGPLGLTWTYNSLAPAAVSPALPAGWSMSLDATQTLAYERIVSDTQSLVLIDATGAIHEYRRPDPDPFSTLKAWVPIDDDDATVSQNAAGQFVVRGVDGLVYLFDVPDALGNSKLLAATKTTDRDDGSPDTGQVFDQRSDHSYLWDAGGRLGEISDRLSGRKLELSYAGVGPQTCDTSGGFSAPTSGRLCRIRYFDNSGFIFETHLKYNAAGDLARIANPGNESTDFAYLAGSWPIGTGRRLSEVVSPLANDAILAGQRSNDVNARTTIAYNADGRVGSVTLPLPTTVVGDLRPRHSYEYGIQAGDTFSDRYYGNAWVDIDGQPQPNGWNRAVSITSLGQRGAETDSSGKTTYWVWHPDNRLRYTDDPTSYRTSTVYDAQKRPTDVYGPAPVSCFNTFSENPNGTCSVPRTRKAYDGAATFSDGTATGATPIRGLAAAYWRNPNLTGAPYSRETGVGGPGGALSVNWGTGGPSTLGQSDNWSAQFTGEIVAPSAGNYLFQVDADDGVRLYIDDHLVFDLWGTCICGMSAQYSKDLTAGPHRIRLEYREATSSAYLHLYWSRPDIGFQLVPGDKLAPRYDLTTSSKDPDGKATNTEYANPERGLPTATVADPLGLALRTTTTYEAPGLAYGYGRPKSTQLPKWQGSSPAVETRYEYYGAAGSEGAIDPCVTGSPLVVQAGMLARTIDPDPAGPDGARVTTLVYDRVGRAIATFASRLTSSPAACVHYDDRGRVIWRRDHALVETNFAYTGLVTTTSFPDSAGTPRTTVEELDLLGRLFKYSDEHGTVTTRTYDQAGRLVRTDRTFPGQATSQLTGSTFDTAGRLASLTDYAAGAGAGRTTTFAYDNAGRLTTITRPNGVTTTNTFDATQKALAGISHQRGPTTLRNFTYAVSLAGVIDWEAESVGGSGATNFTYDGTGRLTKAVNGATVRDYAYDANSNRCATATSCTGSSLMTFDEADRATSSPEATAYQYDAYGNMISRTPKVGQTPLTITYDGNNHAKIIDDGVIRTEETLAPSGRVLRRRVIQLPSTVTEDIIFGYAGPGDSPAYEQPYGAGWANPIVTAENWTGSSGAWNSGRWTTSTSGTATIDLNSDRGRLYVSGGGDARAMALTPATADSEAALTFEFSDLANRSGLRIGLRGCSTQPSCSGPPMNSGYRVDVVSDQSTVSLRRIVGGSHTTLTNFSFSKAANTKYRIRVRLVGYKLSVKLWPASQPEPSAWSAEYDDALDPNKVGGTGKLHLHHNGTAGARSIYVDDLVQTDLTKTRKTYLAGPGGLLATDTNGEATYALGSHQGTIAGITDTGGAFTSFTPNVDEYGVSYGAAPRLGWLGQHQRFAVHNNSGNNLIRMGARLYDPDLGRFLSVDPVEGGSCTDYDYACADPVNNLDIDGERCWTGVARREKIWDAKKKKWKTKEHCRSLSRGAGRAVRAVGRTAVKEATDAVDSVATLGRYAWGGFQCLRGVAVVASDSADIVVGAGSASIGAFTADPPLVAGGVILYGFGVYGVRRSFPTALDSCGLQ